LLNLAIAAACGVLAARTTPGHTECEALRVRRQALEAARGISGLYGRRADGHGSPGDPTRKWPP